jgi:hypothetical protein
VVQLGKDEVKGIDRKSKVEVVRPSKDEVEDTYNKSKVQVARPGKFKEVNR